MQAKATNGIYFVPVCHIVAHLTEVWHIVAHLIDFRNFVTSVASLLQYGTKRPEPSHHSVTSVLLLLLYLRYVCNLVTSVDSLLL